MMLVACTFRWQLRQFTYALCLQPTGLLAYLDSPDPVPEKDVDRMHIRDNLKIATVSEQTLSFLIIESVKKKK